MKNDALIVVVSISASVVAWPVTSLAQASAPVADAGLQVVAVPTPAATAAADELMRLQEDTLLLKAELKKLDVLAQVAERQKSLHQIGNPATNGAMSLLATQSLGGAMSATLTASDGSEFDVRAGDTLAEGTRVAEIRSGAVVLSVQDGHRVTLAVSTLSRGVSRNSLVANSAGSNGVPGMSISPMPPR
ncbi:type IV pilus biogenesis protein PilP [Paraburkholderia sp. SARCC-3016]|uniref:type IV pilus biogenesis protein PilP n=1 Tax=Paraburkholderia sp. SARCC-3016 TaxID=3058611 RepID=UPI002807E6DD|nr:type IV pilus biogenesis protein PilP [Paraburkholderia sp. SARCC-3016]MDQ7980286.1 type IV pilus biogenesis protein PilP [Paraburkholderia sp. SARCC-3016]